MVLTGLAIILCGVGVLFTARAAADTQVELQERLKPAWLRRHPRAPRWLVHVLFPRLPKGARRAYGGYAVGVLGIVAGALTLFGVW